MLKLSACIEMLFTEEPFARRVAAAKEAGFAAYEFWGWANKDLSAVADAAGDANLPAAACSVGTADAARAKAYADGQMLNKRNAGLFAEMVEETAARIRPALDISTFICTVGNTLPDTPHGAQRDAIIECLLAAAPILRKTGCALVLEPLNILVDHKGYFLASSHEAADILRAVGEPRIKMLFDIYHQQITEGNLIDNITAYAPMIGHFHLADVPGRYEPGTGEINYGNVLTAIAKTGYDGYVGCEYRPSPGVASRDSATHILGAARASSERTAL